jgi:metal-dependent amidase/aminoacylase/carboxypeptidase family protein
LSQPRCWLSGRYGCTASTGLLVTFHVERAHAGTPEDGHNPAAAIAELALFANQLQADRGGCLCTVVYVQEGHLNFGISPGDGAIGLTLRTITSVFLKLAETR